MTVGCVWILFILLLSYLRTTFHGSGFQIQGEDLGLLHCGRVISLVVIEMIRATYYLPLPNIVLGF